jgi:hypothetical protein
MPRIYTAGTLLWVDDDFANNPLDTEGGEISVWRKTFGNTDNRIYRLLSLQLEVVTSRNEAFAVIDDLAQVEHQHRFVQAVVDLRIPDQPSGRAEMKHGFAVARRLQERGIPFVFLSSSSSARNELTQRHLDRVPYFTKAPAPSPTMMPEDLARQLLAEFRNRVSWLDLEPILRRLHPGSRHSLKLGNAASRYFPFFGSYRDFVERWEGRNGRLRAMRTVLRAPTTHCPEFITQCLAVILGSASLVAQPRLIYLNSDENSIEVLDSSLVGDDGQLCLAVQLTGQEPEVEQQVIQRILREFRRTILYFILPQDESADPLLRTLAAEPAVVYDDLPGTRLYDRVAREDLIRRTAAFVFQGQRLRGSDTRASSLAPIFQKHPEILIHPVNWTFLLEAEEVAIDLTDPYEVLNAMEVAAKEISKWSPHCVDAIVQGRPSPHGQFLRPAQASFDREKTRHPTWIRRAFRDWLKTSWHTPFGAIHERHDHLSDEDLVKWEDHCLDVACDLAGLFSDCLPYIEKTEPALKHEIGFLAAAARFLQHSAVTKMLASQAEPDDWIGFEAKRWPHAAFPMPAALNRKLKHEGRYLWVQTDLLDRLTVLRGGQRALDRLEARAQIHHHRLEWLEKAIDVLPQGWKEPAARLWHLIEDREIDKVWNDARSEPVWNDLYTFVRNGAPISYLFWSAVANEGIADSHVKVLRDAQGEGKLIGNIRDGRAKFMVSVFEPTEQRTRSWLQSLDEARVGLRFLRDFQDFQQGQRTLSWAQVFTQFADDLDSCNPRYDQNVTSREVNASAREISHKMFANLYDPNRPFQSNAWFDDRRSARDKSNKDNVRDYPALPEWSSLNYGGSRGLVLDHLMLACDTADQLRGVLRPFLDMDGYHLIALLRDIRNVFKEGTPTLDVRLVHVVFETFLLGFEGLVSQLKWCLAGCGRIDLANAIPNATIRLRHLPNRPVPGLDNAMRVTGKDAGDYQVFTAGIAGSRLSGQFAYAVGRKELVFYREPKIAAAE